MMRIRAARPGEAGRPVAPAPGSPADRARAAYLGLAIGDALGATVEFLTPREIASRFADVGGEHRAIIGGGWLNLRSGQVTDDTTMALALGDAILASGGQVVPEACARAFDEWMRAKPVDIGNTVRRGILHFRRSGQAWIEPGPDAGNGAAMRCLPVALALAGAEDGALAAAALAQAWTTHRNPLSDAATVCLVHMVSLALRGEPIQAVEARADALVAEHREFAWRGARETNPSGYIVDTLRAVFQGVFSGADMEHALIDVVNRGGDADTTGAIAGMLLGALAGTQAIPPAWLKQLDGRIRTRCEAQAEALVGLSPAVVC